MNHSQNEQLMARKAAATPRGVGVMGSFFADRAENAELWDVEGRRFIDFAGGIAVMNTGHRHPKVHGGDRRRSSSASRTPATRWCPTRATSRWPRSSTR